jgi:hypothetical protein
MGFQRVSGLTTISGTQGGDPHHHWEYFFFGGVDVGPCYATAEIFNAVEDIGAQLIANNQGVITRLGGGGFTDVTLTYTVDIDNTDVGSSAYFLRVGTFS